ncbi:MAG TPA: hypothetical protein VGE52_12560 [Pirellulales bacterium]
MLGRLAAILSVCVVLAGCSRPAPPAAPSLGELAGLMEQVDDELRTITDETSARAALPRLTSLADRIDDYHARVKAMRAPPEPDEKDKLAARQEFVDRQRAAMVAYDKEIARLSAIPNVLPILDDFTKRVVP